MRELTYVISDHNGADAVLTLPFDKRQRSRFRARLDNGEEVGVYLERGTLLRGGDHLSDSNGLVVAIEAASESVSTVYGDARELTRAAYHLGNRHVHVQVGENWLRYLHDHVLDSMIEQMGLTVVVEQAPFEPEAGAYHGDNHAHH